MLPIELTIGSMAPLRVHPLPRFSQPLPAVSHQAGSLFFVAAGVRGDTRAGPLRDVFLHGDRLLLRGACFTYPHAPLASFMWNNLALGLRVNPNPNPYLFVGIGYFFVVGFTCSHAPLASVRAS